MLFDDSNIFETAYDLTDEPEDLPWHSESLPPLLHTYLAHAEPPLEILDLGSGAGIHSVELAARGHDVVGVDFVENAVEMSRTRAEKRGVDATFVRADALEWEADRTFDVVVDCGLFHGLSTADLNRYGTRLLDRLDENGDFFLSHFARRHPLDWRPVGPNRRTPEEVCELVPDAFELETHAFEIVHPALPVGPTARYGHYWFSRSAD